LGETHTSFVENGNNNNKNSDFTEFISEQVSHHPPITAFIVQNTTHNLKIEAAVSFGVKLRRNSASVTTSGSVLVSTSFSEKFIFSKCVPDLKIGNVINPGPKYIMWIGDVMLYCPESGYCATIQTKEKSHKINSISGVVYHNIQPDKPIYKFEGICGKQTLYWSPDSTKEKQILVDHSLYKEAYIQYLEPSLRPELDSMRLWVPVAKAIIDNDMATADEEKKKIEEAQRVRKTEKENNDSGTYFYKNDSDSNVKWKFKGNLSLVELAGLGKKNNVNLDNHKDIVKENSVDTEKLVEKVKENSGDTEGLVENSNFSYHHPE